MIPAPKHIEPIKTRYNFTISVFLYPFISIYIHLYPFYFIIHPIFNFFKLNNRNLLIPYLSINLLHNTHYVLLFSTSVPYNPRQQSVSQHKVHTNFTQSSYKFHTNNYQLLTYFVPTSYRLRRHITRYLHSILKSSFLTSLHITYEI